MKTLLIVWILWHNGSDIYPLDSFESLAECKSAAVAAFKDAKAAGRSEGGYACFPSDFDPREPRREPRK